MGTSNSGSSSGTSANGQVMKSFLPAATGCLFALGGATGILAGILALAASAIQAIADDAVSRAAAGLAGGAAVVAVGWALLSFGRRKLVGSGLLNLTAANCRPRAAIIGVFLVSAALLLMLGAAVLIALGAWADATGQVILREILEVHEVIAGGVLLVGALILAGMGGRMIRNSGCLS